MKFGGLSFYLIASGYCFHVDPVDFIQTVLFRPFNWNGGFRLSIPVQKFELGREGSNNSTSLGASASDFPKSLWRKRLHGISHVLIGCVVGIQKERENSFFIRHPATQIQCGQA